VQAFLERVIGRVLRRYPSPLNAHINSSLLVSSNELRRLGTKYGGWLIPAEPDLTADSICYLAGAGEDISFDCALASRFNCQVRIIDPTPRAIEHFKELQRSVKEGWPFPINNSGRDFYDIDAEVLTRLDFLSVGLADQDMEMKFYLPRDPSHVSCSTVNLQGTTEFFTAQCHRLSTLLEQQGDAKVDLLKMDIEGGEYVVIQDLVAASLLPRILLIEFDEAHTPMDDGAGARIKSHIEQLQSAGMRCIAVEASNATFVRT
jgi:hypothetical protein